jgi:hypothetical protein
MRENYGNCISNMVVFKNYWKVIFIGKFWKVGKVGTYFNSTTSVDEVT